MSSENKNKSDLKQKGITNVKKRLLHAKAWIGGISSEWFINNEWAFYARFYYLKLYISLL